LDCDIIIDEAPDSVTPALEQWQALIELEKARPGTIPTDVLIKSAPNLKDKAELLKGIKESQQNQGPPPEVQIAQAKLQMDAQKHQQDMQVKAVDAQIEMQRGQAEGMKLHVDLQRMQFDAEKMAQDLEIKRAEFVLKSKDQANGAQESRAKLEGELALKQAQIDQIYAQISQLGAQMTADKEESEAKRGTESTDSKLHQELAQAMLKLAEQMARPKKIIRDASGLVTSVQ
jgi:hypothetical protein